MVTGFTPLLVLLALVDLLSHPAPPRSSHFRTVPLGSGAYAAIVSEPGQASGGNAGFVVGAAAVVVVDSLATEDAARDLLAEIRRMTSVPIRWVVRTHDRRDPAGAAAVFRREGAVVVSPGNGGSPGKTPEEISPPDRARPDASGPPDVTHRERLTLWLGDRSAEVLFRPGHTGGDSILRVAEGDVVFAGDLFWNATVPNRLDADTAAWRATLDGLTRDFPSALFVPGHGEPGRALQVRFFRDYLIALRHVVERGMEMGLTGRPLAEAGIDALRPRYGPWTGFDRFALSNLEQTEQELRGTKRE